MYSFLIAFIIIIASFFIDNTQTQAAIGDQGAALQYQYEVIELNEKTFWLVQFEDQLMQVKDSENTHDALVQYKELVEQTTTIIQSIIFYSIFIFAIIACSIWLLFTKPKLLKHPLFLVCSITACLFAYHITTYYGSLQDSVDNLRYYYLLLENIN